MSGANSHCDIEKACDESANLPWERHLLLSTTYHLDAANSRRIQIGLRATCRPEQPFVSTIELSGGDGEGIRFDYYSWQKFEDNMAIVGAYLRGDTEETPQGILLNENALNFTMYHGSRAIMLFPRTSSLEKNVGSAIADAEVPQPTLRKQKLYRRGVMIQRTAFEGLENIASCILTKYFELEQHDENVEDSATTLIWHIAHRLHKLPKNVKVDSALARRILTDNYHEIKIQMQRENWGETEIVRRGLEVLFSELTTIYVSYIVQGAVRLYFSCISKK